MFQKTQGVLRRHKLMIVAALAAPAVVLAIGPANADPANAEATIVGHGTIAPGLPLQGTSSSLSTVTFTSDAVVYSGEVDNTPFSGADGKCNFSGTSDILESAAQGDGNGTAACSGGSISVSCTLHYSRTGGAVTITGTCSGSAAGKSASNCTLNGGFNFEPTSVNPTKTYELQGQATLTGCS